MPALSGKPVEGAASTPFAGLRAAVPSGRPAEEHGLALGQMRLTIEDGLLMVFGPDGDPVPPKAFTAATAADPAALLDLPDGTTAPASRIAAVLRAQVLGRLGRSAQGSEWILAMLSEAGRPQPASEDQLRAEQDASGAVGGVESQLTVTADAGGSAAGAPPESDDQATSFYCEQIAAAEADAAPATPRLELDSEKRAADDMPDAVRPAQADAKEDAKAVAERTEVDPDRTALGVARGLSTGVRVDDGSWFSSLRNLSTLTIARGAGPGSKRGARAPGGRGDLRTRTVPLAERPGDSGAENRGARGRDKGEPGLMQKSGAGAADSVAGSPRSRTVALGLSPQALAGEGFHALVVRDVPAGARLSAGAYEAALDGWVMQPQDLGTLTISAPPELRADFTVTLMGIALRPGDPNAVRILAWVPVRLA
jgi:hypothetical protein